jgi:hypothetical protein
MPRICVLSVAVLLIGGGCTQPPVEHTVRKVPVDEVRGDTEKAGEAANHVGEKEEKEDFERRLKARLTGIEAEIASLHERGLALKDEARTRWNDTMTDLKAKQKVAHEKLDELGKSTGEAWGHLEKGAQDAWDDLREAVQKAAKEF